MVSLELIRLQLKSYAFSFDGNGFDGYEIGYFYGKERGICDEIFCAILSLSILFVALVHV